MKDIAFLFMLISFVFLLLGCMELQKQINIINKKLASYTENNIKSERIIGPVQYGRVKWIDLETTK